MSRRFLTVLAGVALAASATSAFAFDAILSSPKALHTHPWHRSAVIEVLAPTTVINIVGCRHGWCQAQAPNGPVGFVHTPVLVGAVPAPGWWWNWGAWTAPVLPVAVAAPAPIVAADPVRVRAVPVAVAPAPVAAAAVSPFGLFDIFAPAPAPVAPVVASY
jgi:Bacterial SH3 domain